MTQRLLTTLLLFALLIATALMTVTARPRPPAAAQSPVDVRDHRATMFALLSEFIEAARGRGGDPALFATVAASGDRLYIAPLVDLAFFARSAESPVETALFAALAQLTGLPATTGWQAYLEWASAQNVPLPPAYDQFKGLLLGTIIDPNFARFFAPGVQETARINLLEAVWGGVIVDGIPPLSNARQISPADAAAEGETLTEFCRLGVCDYPAANELVFGVSLNGDARAYPLRLLNWHEMFNDVIGSAPLYTAPAGEEICRFRAPTLFQATARAGTAWVEIHGESAGCAARGWLAADVIEWVAGDAETALAALPDIQAGEQPRAPVDGIAGRVKGTPVTLAYCTLCGAGILYATTVADLVVDGVARGQTVLTFSSTGLLMRSNKLMYDRQTNTVWNALTGEPAFGPLATTDLRLPVLPVVVTDWRRWQRDHPQTSVLSLQTGFRRDYRNGAAYSDYFNDPAFLMFPVWQQDTSDTANKEVIFALRINDTPKAYPLRHLIASPVLNDTLAGVNVVLVTEATPAQDFFEPGGAAVRAYIRDDWQFSATDTPGEVIDESGGRWQVTEGALVAADGRQLARLGGHLAFWFGWYAFYPETLVFMPE